jgi:uncharacterized RDD family membrane protein YckC
MTEPNDPFVSPGAPPSGFGEQPAYGQQPGFGAPQYAPTVYAQADTGLPPGVEPGGLGKRFLARIVDALVFIPITIAVLVITKDSSLGAKLAGNLCQLILAAIYESLMLARFGKTLGKMAAGVKVVSLETGQIPAMDAVVKRTCFYTFSVVAVYIGALVTYLSPLFDSSPRRRGWPDKWAGTVVIKG